jgi:hypothetical protein
MVFACEFRFGLEVRGFEACLEGFVLDESFKYFD